MNPPNFQKAVEVISGLVVRILLCGGFAALAVRSIASKRKGIGLLTFSLVWAIGCVWLAYTVHAATKAAAKGKDSDRRLAANTIAGLDETLRSFHPDSNQEATPIKPTGDPKNDALVQLMNYMVADLSQNIKGMIKEKEAMGLQDIFNASLVVDRGGLIGEIAKRTQWLSTIDKYRQNLAGLEGRCAARCASLSISEEDKQGAIRGLHDGLAPAINQYGQQSDLLKRQAQAELELLRFLVANFGGYKMKGNTLYFTTNEIAARYNNLARAVQDATSALSALQQTEADAYEKAKADVKKMGQ